MSHARPDSPESSASSDPYQSLLQEYEEFVYVVSHDLRAPLRHIEGFSRILLKRHEETFDEKSRRDFNFVIDGVERCKAILDALQSLALLKPAGVLPVDATAVVTKALGELQPLIDISGALIRYESLPDLRGDEGLFITLFREVLENALQYRRPDQAPVILVTATRLPDSTRFCVTDNGAGIATSHLENVFKVFHRGGRRDGAPGKGLGLTRARRIVQLYGGRIWIETTGPTGTTLCFTVGMPWQR